MRNTVKKILVVFAVLLVLVSAAPVVHAETIVKTNTGTNAPEGAQEQTANSTGLADAQSEAQPPPPSENPEAETPQEPASEPPAASGSNAAQENQPPAEAESGEEQSSSEEILPVEEEEVPKKEGEQETTAPEGDTADAVEIMPMGTNPIDAYTIEVDDYDGLRWALFYGTYTTIRLTADITPNGSNLLINSNKASVVIDGTRPDGGRYTLTQTSWNGTAITINSNNNVTKKITLRNVNVVGAHEYGAVNVSNSITGVELIYENVSYTGPQASYNRNGTTRILGGSYTLTKGELAESLHVELGGNLTIRSTSMANSIVWLTQSSSTLTIQPGANIDVEAAYYFLYTTQPVNITLPSGSRFSLTSGTFGFTYDLQRVGDFVLQAGSELYISLHTTRSTAALRVARLFQMEPGSKATILRTGTGGIPLRLTNGGAQAVFNQPGRVFFYSSAGVPLRFTGQGTLSLRTSALNLWQNTGWPPAGGVETQPSHIWNKAGEEILELTVNYSTSTNQGMQHNLAGTDPVSTPLNATNFNLENSQLFALGQTSLEVTPPDARDTTITGSAPTGAEVQATYQLAGGSTGNTGGTADTGSYALPVAGGTLLGGSTVSVVSRHANLFMRQNATVTQSIVEKLAFSSVPGSLEFAGGVIPGGAALVPRRGDDFALSVEDTRQSPSPWYIEASMENPMTANVNGQQVSLPGAIVFVGEDGQPTPLGKDPTVVYRQNNPGSTGTVETLQWAPNEGILLRANPGALHSDAAYNATIHWTLVSAP